MEIKVHTLNASHLTAVDNLGRSFRATLGFLPEEALRKILTRGWVFGATTASGELAGYLIFARYDHYFRITQLCVSKAHRGHGIARKLLISLKDSATTQSVIKLRCRRDFPAHQMWPKLGFIPVDEMRGRSESGHRLTLWNWRIAPDDELGLWRSDTADDTLDVVIDAQVFFDFDSSESPSTLISKGLLNDYLVDSLNMWITDEIFNEIDRNQDASIRKSSRERAHAFGQIDYDREKFERFRENLQAVLPYRTESERSDIHHLAKVSASVIRTFVTKDERVLRKSDAIKRLCAIDVLHPVEVITSLHEAAERLTLSPSRVSGLRLGWRVTRKPDIEHICSLPFKDASLTRSRLRERLLSFSANPIKHLIQHLCTDEATVAYRVVDCSTPGVLNVSNTDVVESPDKDLFASFVIADSLSLAVERDLPLVTFSNQGTPVHMEDRLQAMGFVRGEGSHQRLVITRSYDRRPSLAEISGINKESLDALSAATDLEFERFCAPAVFGSQRCFLIPIQPTFAMGLIDRHQSESELFGGDPTVLLRWENVYYRSKTCHHMLKHPARILWYVSGHIKEIVAISHLDEVVSGLPKVLFKKYRKFGILEWRDVFKLCRKDVDREIMALKFSQTFCFRHRVPLSHLRSIFEDERKPFSLQAPFLLSHSALLRIFDAGYGRC